MSTRHTTLRYPKRPANPFFSPVSLDSCDDSTISSSSRTQLVPLATTPGSGGGDAQPQPVTMSFRRRPMLFFPNGGEFEPFESAYPMFNPNQNHPSAQTLWYDHDHHQPDPVLQATAQDASDTSDGASASRRRSRRGRSSRTAAPAAVTVTTAQRPAFLEQEKPAEAVREPTVEKTPLRAAMYRLHKEVTKAHDYYSQQLAAFESEMSAVQDFASINVQESLWRDRVEIKGGDRFKKHGRHIQVMMEQVDAEHEQVVILDNFAEARFRSIVSLLASTTGQIADLCGKARQSSLDCQMLIDTLVRAHELSNPDSPKIYALWTRVDDGAPAKKKTKKRMPTTAAAAATTENATGSPAWGGDQGAGQDGWNQGDAGAGS